MKVLAVKSIRNPEDSADDSANAARTTKMMVGIAFLHEAGGIDILIQKDTPGDPGGGQKQPGHRS